MSLMTLYFPNEIDEHGTFAKIEDIVDGVIPHDEYVDEMFAMNDVIVVDDLFDGPIGLVEEVSNFVDSPLSFDVLSGFVSHHDDIFDIDDEIAQYDSDDDLSYASDSDPIDQKVSPTIEDTEVVDFGTVDQPRELRIRSDLSTNERDNLIQLLRSYLDSFAWSYEDMSGFDLSMVKEEIQKQLSMGFLSVVEYSKWLANVVHVPKRMAIMSFDVVLYGRIFRVQSDSDGSRGPGEDVLHYRVRLRLNPKKCTFGVTSRKFLRYMVSERGIEVDPDKIRVILDMFALRTERECQRAFEKIREYLLSSLILAPHTPSRPLLLHLSVSDVASGCMLAQLND
ncbi:hypothetical protein CK203_072619 [Vitis vinifera]|uniref:Reverse transcriptase/retrotransposon-derived protein RNase H-like domain-containing protein n=1 Tax=Vitis vinifera TaxID=29760 RepID=A0A438EZD1_VITVI|nr:hypothetical protein CK203_072619 [Vitis vinifera]